MDAATKKHQEWIRKAREATGARSVALGKVPAWAKTALRAAVRRDGGSLQRGEEATYLLNWRRTTSLVQVFDHLGSSTMESRRYRGPTLVGEPYADRRHIEAALAFADWIGCDVEIGDASWWYPANTTRIEFFPKRG